MSAYPHLHIATEVAEALGEGRPVVALESTIISHGFPYPSNVECALRTEAVVREAGATPATIAIIGGELTVGLTPGQIEHLARAGQDDVVKASRRDIGRLVAQRLDGATTVAGTMLVSALASIRVFATGGIGGVHRGAQESFDVSADLLELARTPVAVVCAGAKSILDLGLTLEVLETHGVPVWGFATDDFPSFYARTSGFGVDARFDDPAAVAQALSAQWELGMQGGAVIGNPIPVEYEIDRNRLDTWTEQALSEARTLGVRGKQVTPFLLARLHQLSEGATEEANKQLVYSNAALAARIAAELG